MNTTRLLELYITHYTHITVWHKISEKSARTLQADDRQTDGFSAIAKTRT